MKGVVIAMMVVLAMVSLMVEPGQAITCQQVTSNLTPCVPYLTQGGTPSQTCCAGVKSIRAMTPTTADRRACCECVKGAAQRYGQEIRPDSARQLPKQCGVDIGVPITKDVNCNAVP